MTVSLPRIISVANQKGGVGKTTTAVNLATALCSVGKRVLLLDFDPQGNATTGLGLHSTRVEKSAYYFVLGKASFQDVTMDCLVDGLKIIPATIQLAAAELELPNMESGATTLKQRLREAKEFDYILIDCPPSLNFLTLNALVACQSVLVPLQCEYYALEGLGHLLDTVRRVREQHNPQLKLEGILLTMFDVRNKLSGQVSADVKHHLADLVFKTVIPRNVRVSEAPSHGLPVLLYALRSAGATAYVNLAAEILERETAPQPSSNLSSQDASIRANRASA